MHSAKKVWAMIEWLELAILVFTWLMRIITLCFIVCILVILDRIFPSLASLTQYPRRLTFLNESTAPLGALICVFLQTILYFVRKYLKQKALIQRSKRFIRKAKIEQISFSDLRIMDNAPLSHMRSVATIIRDLGNRSNVDSINLLNEIIAGGFSVGASDIHLTPERDKVYISYRVDGVLHDLGSVSHEAAGLLRNRMKVLARLSIETKNKPQDGAIAFDVEDYHIRVSFMPTSHKEKAVLRLAVHDEKRYNIDSLGLDSNMLNHYKVLLGSDHGLVYLTGPTGSGKTTTLYASLMHIRQVRGDTVNMATLEDPIEVDFSGVSQTQVNPASQLTFAVGLRSILRQDPDVIMVGEIRDEETAQVAIRAGLSGHLILTTVHADSTAGVFNRLKQLHVERFQIASASLAVVNQRLAISNCPDCRKEMEIATYQKKQLEMLGLSVDGPFYAGTGCDTCGGKGRVGRIPLFELLPVTDSIRDLLVAETPTHKLLEAARKEGMVPLAVQALDLAKKGELSIDEVIRVLSAGIREDQPIPTLSDSAKPPRKKRKSSTTRSKSRKTSTPPEE
jgi:general secretion pathway protein E